MPIGIFIFSKDPPIDFSEHPHEDFLKYKDHSPVSIDSLSGFFCYVLFFRYIFFHAFEFTPSLSESVFFSCLLPFMYFTTCQPLFCVPIHHPALNTSLVYCCFNCIPQLCGIQKFCECFFYNMRFIFSLSFIDMSLMIEI